MLVTEAIQRFLTFYTHADLAARYNEGMEVQVMVRPDGGTLKEGSKSYTNGLYDWFPIRVPKNARTTPEFKNFTLQFPLAEHCLAVGMTGWDFMERRSKHVAYDFDAIMGESHAGTGISIEDLDRVKEAACKIPWVEARRSTSGGGLHLYVSLGKGIPTDNHTEHSALARAILGMMSAAAGFNFADKVDICGGNMWVYHRKMTTDNQGLKLIKPREHDLIDVPENWRDHIDVVSNKRRKVKIAGIPDSAQESFGSKAEGSKSIPLDDTHRKLMDWLVENGWTCVWEPDYGMLRTHTAALQEAHGKLEFKGMFKTLATGRDKGDYNCFAFPRPEGSWRVVRYGEGALESDTWVQDGEGWTYCFLNQRPDLKSVAAAKGGIEDEKDGGYVFPNLIAASEAVALLGGTLDVDEYLKGRPTKLKTHKDGKRLVVQLKKEKSDTDEQVQHSGYLPNKNTLTRVVGASLPDIRTELRNFDNKIRYLLSPSGGQAGWVINIQSDWFTQPKDNAISVLMSQGMTSSDAKAATGNIVEDGWRLCNMPFQPEYPGGRRWNKDAAQFRFKPLEEDSGEHPHWDKVMAHCGKGLNSAVAMNEWCKTFGLHTGGDYLKYWCASMFQHPYARLPYLFFFSEPYQNCGKSTFYQALNLLMTSGVQRADNALTSSGNFNGELLGAILCVVEEIDLSRAGSRAYEKIKDWVTSDNVNIHIKNLTPYMQANTSHWVHCSNFQRACPIFDGDTRVTMIQVSPLAPGTEIPWGELQVKLQDEAPAFLRTLLDTVIPPSGSRLKIPVIETEDKIRALELTRDELQTFLAEKCFFVPGAKTGFAEFYEAFMAELGISERAKWTRNKISTALPPKYPRGVGTGGKTYIGNLSLVPLDVDPNVPLLTRYGNKLVQEEEVAQ